MHTVKYKLHYICQEYINPVIQFTFNIKKWDLIVVKLTSDKRIKCCIVPVKYYAKQCVYQSGDVILIVNVKGI